MNNELPFSIIETSPLRFSITVDGNFWREVKGLNELTDTIYYLIHARFAENLVDRI